MQVLELTGQPYQRNHPQICTVQQLRRNLIAKIDSVFSCWDNGDFVTAGYYYQEAEVVRDNLSKEVEILQEVK